MSLQCRCPKGKADPAHEVRVARILADAIEFHGPELVNSSLVSLIRLFQPLERLVRVAQSDIQSREVHRRDAFHPVELLHNAESLGAIPGVAR